MSTVIVKKMSNICTTLVPLCLSIKSESDMVLIRASASETFCTLFKALKILW